MATCLIATHPAVLNTELLANTIKHMIVPECVPYIVFMQFVRTEKFEVNQINYWSFN